LNKDQGALVTTPPALLWTSKDFQQLMLPDCSGNAVYWVDMFYKELDHDFGIIPKGLFLDRIDSFPPYLLHSMLACCYKASVLPLSAFDPHFQSAVKLMNPDKLSVFTCMAEISLAMFCYFSGYQSYGIPFFTRAIATSNLIGLSQGYADPIPGFDTEEQRILALRTWMSLYSVDYFYRLLWKVPCLMSPDVPAPISAYFKKYVTKGQLFQEDNMLSFSIYLIPLYNIGKRFFHHLDGNSSIEDMDSMIDQLTSELNQWQAGLPGLDPFTECKEGNFTTERFWDTFLMINYHLLYMVIMSHRFARRIEHSPLSDPAIYHSQQHANRITSLFVGCTHHYQSFERMTGMLAQYAFLSALIHCSLGFRDSCLLQKALLHLRFLKTPPVQKFDFKVTPQLEKYTNQPYLAIEHLKKVNKLI
jgi:hypothetical protein